MNTHIGKSDKRFEARVKLVEKLIPYMRKNGLQTIRMDEIAKVMEISRATLYKYFPTKEEIIRFIVDGFVEYMNELPLYPLESEQSFGIRLQQIFEQSVSLVVYFTEIFLKELETSYPTLYDGLSEAMKQREHRLLAFYEEGKQKGIFNDINGKLIIMQDELLRGMFNVKYLMTNQLTVQQVLNDYYRLKKIQLFKSEKLSVIDDTSMTSRIGHLTQKITKNLF